MERIRANRRALVRVCVYGALGLITTVLVMKVAGRVRPPEPQVGQTWAVVYTAPEGLRVVGSRRGDSVALGTESPEALLPLANGGLAWGEPTGVTVFSSEGLAPGRSQPRPSLTRLAEQPGAALLGATREARVLLLTDESSNVLAWSPSEGRPRRLPLPGVVRALPPDHDGPAGSATWAGLLCRSRPGGPLSLTIIDTTDGRRVGADLPDVLDATWRRGRAAVVAVLDPGPARRLHLASNLVVWDPVQGTRKAVVGEFTFRPPVADVGEFIAVGRETGDLGKRHVDVAKVPWRGRDARLLFRLDHARITQLLATRDGRYLFSLSERAERADWPRLDCYDLKTRANHRVAPEARDFALFD